MIRSGPCPGFLFVLLSLVAASWASAARAGFHDGGVGSCGGCHVLHESEDGTLVPAGADLLRAETSTDTCLLCHSSGPHSVFGASVFLPGPEVGGGDFVFLLEDQINDAHNGAMRPIAGEAAGHSIVAPGAGLVADSRWLNSPGGNFPVADLGCTSCHDPHGSASFRMLNGAGPIQDGFFSFTHGAPAGEGIDASASIASESRDLHTAYRDGWSLWCGNCHGPDYHGAGGASSFVHPVDEPLGSTAATWYGAFAGDLDATGGDPLKAYLAEVPFEDPLATPTSAEGPAATSRINCMTCHRAHATSGPASGRWDFHVDSLGDDGVVSGSYAIPNPYLDPNQRQLCVKCHDTGGHDRGHSCMQCHGRPRGGGGPVPDPFQD